MLITFIVKQDGSTLASGLRHDDAIQSATLTQCVNSGTELTVGSVCAAMLQLQLFAPQGSMPLSTGEEFTAYKVDEKGKPHKIGVFTVEKPVRKSANTVEITAYDRVSRLDRDLTDWLGALDGWAYSLLEFSKMVCEACGVTLINEQIPNGSYLVQPFTAQGVTGRQLLQWAGQLAGRFCHATEDGDLEFAWYTPAPVSIGLDAQQLRFYQGSLQAEDYVTAPIEKVQLRSTQEDVGVVYPDTEDALNTYVITGNYLLNTASAEDMRTVAQGLYEQLCHVQYTPCKVQIPASVQLAAGQSIQITDGNGRCMEAYIMTRTQSGQRDTLECTGSARLDCSTAVNNQNYQALTGKVLELRKDVEGLHLENRDADQRLSSVELTVDGLGTQVASQQSELSGVTRSLTSIQQTAQQAQLLVQQLREEGVQQVTTTTGYTFDAAGLRIHKSGSEMENLLDNTGMYVKRSGTTILQANNAGVVAKDVTVNNYLVLGSYARFEDYSDGTDTQRTACFWTGGQ